MTNQIVRDDSRVISSANLGQLHCFVYLRRTFAHIVVLLSTIVYVMINTRLLTGSSVANRVADSSHVSSRSSVLQIYFCRTVCPSHLLDIHFLLQPCTFLFLLLFYLLEEELHRHPKLYCS